MPAALDAFFQADSCGGERLYLHHVPTRLPVRGAIVYAHPFAEEMNKSRRMAAVTGRTLAAKGWAVLQIDLHGCGDSSGDFGDAHWNGWVDDICEALSWLAGRHPGVPLWLWGLRTGALLVTAASDRLGGGHHLLLWQPATQGKATLQQFLRLKAANGMAEGQGKAILETARADLAGGRSVDVAGYLLNPALAQGLDAAALNPPAGPAGRLVWLEVSTAREPRLSPTAQNAVPGWQAAGWQVEAAALTGPAFWQTTEIEDAPSLVDATIRALCATGEGP